MVKQILKKIRLVFYKIRVSLFLRNIAHLGMNVTVFFPVKIHGKLAVSIGDNSSMGEYVHIWGNGGVHIGNNVLIAAHCCISSLNHDYSKKTIREGGILEAPVFIEDDVWLGYNVVVLPGVTIGEGSVIGAGSVVTSNIPKYSIAVGNPAKVIKKREVNLE